MKTIYQIIGLLCLILTSCSSQEDEPDMSYKGPWHIMFVERFAYIHNDSEELNNWFYNHTNNWSEAQFVAIGKDSKPTMILNATAQIIEHYTERLYGYIRWEMYIQTLPEDDLKSMIAEFESFTIIESETRFDKFSAEYIRLNDSQ